MNAVQSFWISKKSINAGGWINKRFEYISWSLSYCLLRKNFDELHLYCNSAGAKMLVEDLGLAYDKVSRELDNQEDLMKQSWALTKIFTYATQQEPYAHVDGDVFWFEKPSDDFLKAEAFAQCIEVDEPMYKTILLSLEKDGAYIPEFLKQTNAKAGMAANVGIVGGNHLSIFREFYEEVIVFLDKNKDILAKNPEIYSFVPYFIEQLIFLYLVNYRQVKIKFLRKPVFRSNFIDVIDFNKISAVSQTPGFIHLLGSSKYKLHLCNMMEYWLHRFWPEQLEKINKLYQQHKHTQQELRNMLNPENEKRLPHIKWIFDKPEDVLAYPFIRTQTIFGVNIENNTLRNFENHTETEKLTDCVGFEKQRLEIVKNLLQKTDSNAIFLRMDSHLDFCLKSYEQLSQLTFSFNKALVLKSKFNWFNDLVYASEYYWYTLIIDSQKECFQEFLLSEAECEMLEMFQGETSFQELVTAWNLKYPAQNPQKNGAKIYEMLKELIGLDLIKYNSL
ncbi:DUF6734 family protein [Emticicia sp. 17c]|uniref:DUF6734 family protein n=1 Tax=Emticicia sp. 17c TaxID=3127704 RepID=UPI00301C432F